MRTNQKDILPTIALVLTFLKNLNLNLIAFALLIYAIAIKFSEGQLGFVSKNASVIALLVFLVATLNDYLKPATLLSKGKILFLNDYKTILFRAVILAILAIGGLLLYIPYPVKIWIVSLALVAGGYLYIFNRILAKSQYEWLRLLMQSILLVGGSWGIAWLGHSKTNSSIGACFIIFALFAQNVILRRSALTEAINNRQKKYGNSWPIRIVFILMTIVIITGTMLCSHLESRFLARLTVILISVSIVQAIGFTRLKQLQKYRLSYFILDWILIFPAIIF